MLKRRRTSISCGGPKEPGSSGTAIHADRRRTRAVPATACSADLHERIRHQSEDSPTVTQQPLGTKPSDPTPQCKPRAGTSTHRGSRDKQPDEASTAITAIAHNMLTGPPVTLSSAHLTSEQVAKWVQHQRTQLEAGTGKVGFCCFRQPGRIRQKKFVIQIQTTNLTIFQIQNTCNMGRIPIRPIPFGPSTITIEARPIWALQLGPFQLGPPFRPIQIGPIQLLVSINCCYSYIFNA